jgi:hypothetical protein
MTLIKLIIINMDNISVNLKLRYNGLDNASLVCDNIINFNPSPFGYIPNEYLHLSGGKGSNNVVCAIKYHFEENKDKLNYCIRREDYTICVTDYFHDTYFRLKMLDNIDDKWNKLAHSRAYLVFEIMSNGSIIDVINCGRVKDLEVVDDKLSNQYDPLKCTYLKIPDNKYGLSLIEYNSHVNEFHKLYELNNISIDRKFMKCYQKDINPQRYF